MTAPALVVLAAGLGSRYGGLKQLDRLGPGGATLMDYAVHDGWRAGIRDLVFVIRPEMAGAFEPQVATRYRGRCAVQVVFQRMDDLPGGEVVPPGRARPWGTTHAVLAAREALAGNFLVLNADDFYGRDAITTAVRFLAGREPAEPRHAVVGYRLDQTASVAGGVNRALLTTDPRGALRGVRELQELVRAPDGWFEGRDGGAPCRIAADALVSMNLWAFTPAIFPVLEQAFGEFLAGQPGPSGECYLPDGVRWGIDRGRASVEVLQTTSRWCGVTYAADRGWVEAELRGLVAAGAYPERLWD